MLHLNSTTVPGAMLTAEIEKYPFGMIGRLQKETEINKCDQKHNNYNQNQLA